MDILRVKRDKLKWVKYSKKTLTCGDVKKSYHVTSRRTCMSPLSYLEMTDSHYDQKYGIPSHYDINTPTNPATCLTIRN